LEVFMETMHLFDAHEQRPELDDLVEVRPNIWLLPSEEVPPLLFTAEEAGRVLGVGRCKVYDLIRMRELRSVKVGASRRISARALSDYVRALEELDPA
jgi:excisionase family DNA binding protein